MSSKDDGECTSARSVTYSSYRKLMKSAQQDDFKMSEYINVVSGVTRVEDDVGQLDHTYARSSNWRPQNYLAKPCRYLFKTVIRKSVRTNDGSIDIETIAEEPVVPLMPLLNQSAFEQSSSDLDDHSEDVCWEEKISKAGWSPIQIRILPKVVHLIEGVQLPRLVFKGQPNEVIQVENALRSASSKLFHLLTSVSWDKKVTQWLHTLLMKHLTPTQKNDYLSLLALVRKKSAMLVDRMMTPVHVGRSSLVKDRPLEQVPVDDAPRFTDQVAEILSNEKFRKLPHDPVFLLLPNSVVSEKTERFTTFVVQLRQMAQVEIVTFSTSRGTTINHCLDQMMADTRAKLAEVCSFFAGRPIILIGWSVGAAIACIVAQLEPVHAVICLGYPLKNIDCNRDQPNVSILDIACPVLFIIGARSELASQEDMEDMRAQMRVPNQLVLVGSCNDQLLMSRKEMSKFSVTQTMIDRSLVVEIYNFVGELLTQPPLPPPRPGHHSKVQGVTVHFPATPNKKKRVAAKMKEPTAKQLKILAFRQQLSKEINSVKTDSHKVPAHLPTTLSKCKPRMSQTQKVIVNYAKYVTLPPHDYAAKLLQLSKS